MRNYLFRITKPSFWIQNYPSNSVLDEWLNEQLDKQLPVIVDKHHVKFGDKLVWVENYPYAYGYVIGMAGILPFARTRKRLQNAVIKASLKNGGL